MKARTLLLLSLLILFLLFLLIVLPVSSAMAGGYLTIGGGAGGEANTSSGRLEVGGRSTDRANNMLFGVGWAFTLGRNELPDGTNEYPVPHWNFTDLGSKKKGEENGFYLKVGFEPIPSSDIFLFALGGYSYGEEVRLAQSNVTGWYYEESKSTDKYGVVGGGIGYFPKNGGLCVHADYDNRMGVSLNLGISF